MFYKKEENGNWVIGLIVCLTDGIILDENNKLEIDGWEWFDESPEDYVIWKKENEINIEL